MSQDLTFNKVYLINVNNICIFLIIWYDVSDVKDK